MVSEAKAILYLHPGHRKSPNSRPISIRSQYPESTAWLDFNGSTTALRAYPVVVGLKEGECADRSERDG
tara:strand:+ start:30 stop:236 length:207 start_codon:yes stop_codon:yes gene_type:complete